MKKSHKRLLVFEIIIMIISFVSSIFLNILESYKMIIFLLAVLFVFKKIFGFEKRKKENEKDTILELLIFIITFILIYYLFGMTIGFILNGTNILQIVIPLILYILLREYLRYQSLVKAEQSTLLTILSIIFIMVLDISYNYEMFMSNTEYTKGILWIMMLLPIISTNIVYSYVSKKSGPFPTFFYASIISIYRYVLPIIPNIPITMNTMIDSILPALLWSRLTSFYKRVKERTYNNEYNKLNLSILIVPTVIIATMIYFTSGYFRFEAIAIATDTIEKDINKGDIVIVDKKIINYKIIEVGEAIAYRVNNNVFIGRVIRKANDQGIYTFLIKNEKEELQEITEANVIGTIHYKLRYLGYPAIWFNQ